MNIDRDQYFGHAIPFRLREAAGASGGRRASGGGATDQRERTQGGFGSMWDVRPKSVARVKQRKAVPAVTLTVAPAMYVLQISFSQIQCIEAGRLVSSTDRGQQRPVRLCPAPPSRSASSSAASELALY